MRDLFRGLDEFGDVFEKDGKVVTIIPADSRSYEIEVSASIEGLSDKDNKEVAIIQNRLYINGVVLLSAGKSIFIHYPAMDMFSVDWITASRVNSVNPNEVVYHAFGWDNETEIPVFTSITYLLEQNEVVVNEFRLLEDFLSGIITDEDKGKLFEVFCEITMDQLTAKLNDGLTITKWFVENNLVKTIERNIISILAKKDISIVDNMYRRGVSKFVKYIGNLIGFRFIEGGFKDQMDYRIYGAVANYEFNTLIEASIHNQIAEGYSTLNIYPESSEFSFKHLNLLIQDMLVKVKEIEGDIYDYVKKLGVSEILLPELNTVLLEYTAICLDHTNKGVEVLLSDEYGDLIKVIDGEHYLVKFETIYDYNDMDEDELKDRYKSLTELIISPKYTLSNNPDKVACSLIRVTLNKKLDVRKVYLHKTETVITYILSADKDKIESDFNHFASLETGTFTLRNALLKYLR